MRTFFEEGDEFGFDSLIAEYLSDEFDVLGSVDAFIDELVSEIVD